MRKVFLSTPKVFARRFSTATATGSAIHTAIGTLPVINSPTIVNTLEWPKWPVFRIMEPSGKIVEGVPEPEISEGDALKMYQYMVRIQYLDEILYNAQRQGRISFYMQANGEEAIHIGIKVQIYCSLKRRAKLFSQYFSAHM